MKFFSKIFILLILLVSVYSLKSLSNLKLDSSDFEPSPEFSKQIPIVKGYEKMLEVYTFLFNAEQPKKSIGTDKIDKWNDYIILYRSSLVKNQLSRVVLSIQKMSFFCGVGKLCSIEEVSSKINQNEFAPQTSAFIQGLPDKKDCYADGYVWKSKTYGIVLCVNPSQKEKLFDLFKGANPLDYKKDEKASEVNVKETKTIPIIISDGFKVQEKSQITFDQFDVKSNGKTTFMYQYIEPYNGLKCGVKQEISIVPPIFVEALIFNPNCVLKFVYNKAPVYFGLEGNNCAKDAAYALNKMKSSCMNYINGPSRSWKNELSSSPDNGRWKGFIFYHKVLDGGGKISAVPFKLNIGPDEFTISDSYNSPLSKLKMKEINWECNEDGDCSIDNFLKHLSNINQQNKLNDFSLVVSQLTNIWKMQDYNSCFVVEDKDIHIICPTDPAEELNLKTALSIQMDKTLYNADLKTYTTPPFSSTYRILYTTDSSNVFAESDVIVTKKSIKTLSERRVLIDYKNIKEFNGVKCGIDYNSTKDSLPAQFHEQRSSCCAKIGIEEGTFTFCIIPISKCYKNLREMIKIIIKGCKAVQSQNEGKASMTSEFSINPKAGSSWTGPVFFMELNNYGTKGENQPLKGIMSVSDQFISFEAEIKKFKFNTETSIFGCGNGIPCSINQLKEIQAPYLQAETDENWFKLQIKSFEDFVKGKVDFETDCASYVSKNESIGNYDSMIFCIEDKTQVSNCISSFPLAYSKCMDNMTNLNPNYNTVPSSDTNKIYKAIVISGDESTDLSTAKPVNNKIKVSNTGLYYEPSHDLVFNYCDLVFDETTNYADGLNSFIEGVPPTLANQISNKNCCFKASTQAGMFWFICYPTEPQCVYQKMSTVKYIDNAVAICKKKKEKKVLDEKAVMLNRETDSFDFDLEVPYKKFDKNFNFGDLMSKNFDNSNNGEWSGWGYHTPLTDKTPKKIKPIFISISNGKINLSVDENSEPYRKINLFQFEPVCGDAPCPPQKYLQIYSKIFNFSNQSFLENTINNSLSQMYRKFRPEACMILDLTEPQLVTGASDMICTIDPTHGENIIKAVKTSYYLSLLNLNIDTDIRQVVWDIDKFKVRIFIDGKYAPKFNSFHLTKNNLIGELVDKDGKTVDKAPKYILNYKDIAADQFGSDCGFWYKNLKVSQNKEAENIVKDDNCCFKFFTSPATSEVVICVFEENDRICIKRMKELMKGIKDACIDSKASSFGLIPSASNIVADDFSLKTIDDSANGVFFGFAYMAPLFNASNEIPSNPFFVKITNNWISLFNSPDNKDPFQSVAIESLEFNCDEFSACNVSKFTTKIKSIKKYAPYVNNVRTVIEELKQKQAEIRDKMEKICKVLETSNNAYIICSYNPDHAKAINTAIVRAYVLHHSCKKLTSVIDEKPGKVRNIVIMKDRIEQKEIIVTQKGVIEKSTGSILINFGDLENDPINNNRCAIWFKEIPLMFKFSRPECCFMIIVDKKPMTICNLKKGVCVGDTFKLIKQVWNGCMFGQPKINSITKPIIDTRIDICPALRSLSIIKDQNIEREFSQDYYQDIVFSKTKSLYKGWFNLYPIEINQEASKTASVFYGELTPESFKFFNNEKENRKEIINIRPDMLSTTCSNKLCTPLEFIEKFTRTFKPDFAYYKKIMKARIDQYEGSNDKGCTVLEYNVNGISNYFSICPHILNVKSENPKLQAQLEDINYINGRSILSLYYGNISNKIMLDCYAKARKFTTFHDLPRFDGLIHKIKFTYQETRSNNIEVAVNNEGVFSGSQSIIKFKDMAHCTVRYNLIYAPEDIVINNKFQCVLRYRGPKFAEYIAIDSASCEIDTYRLAYQINQKCKKKQNKPQDNVFNELNGGTSFNFSDFIKGIKRANVVVDQEVMNLEEAKKLPTDVNKVKYRSILWKYALDASEFVHLSLAQFVLKGGPKQDGREDTLPDQTLEEDPKTIGYIKSYEIRWKGSNESFEFEAAKGEVTKFIDKNSKKSLITMKDLQMVSSKDYQLIFSEKHKYSLLILLSRGKEIIELKDAKIFVWKTLEKTHAAKTFQRELGIFGLKSSKNRYA